MARWMNRRSFCLWVCLGKFAGLEEKWEEKGSDFGLQMEGGLSNKTQRWLDCQIKDKRDRQDFFPELFYKCQMIILCETSSQNPAWRVGVPNAKE